MFTHRPENIGQQCNIFCLVGRLIMVCLRHLKVYLVQHDILWPRGLCTPISPDGLSPLYYIQSSSYDVSRNTNLPEWGLG